MSHGPGLERLLLPMISRVGTRTLPRPATATSANASTTKQKPVTAQAYGQSFFAAQDLGASIRRQTQLLGDPPLTNAFGAHDQWAAVDEAAKPSTSKKPASSRDEPVEKRD